MESAAQRMTLPRVTIITAALNPGPEVRQTIESVLSQCYQDIEYIFVDGGSRDDAFAHVEPYAERLSLLIREPDAGISDAWNKAIARATGKVIGIINADDYLMPGAITAVVAAYAAHGGAPIVHGDVVRIENGRETARTSTIPFWLMLRFGTPVFHPATFVPATVYRKVGVFDRSMRLAMDYDFILRAYLAGVDFVRVAQPLAGFRSGGVSDRNAVEAFREVRVSQIANGLNRPFIEAIHAAKVGVRKYVRPLFGL